MKLSDVLKALANNANLTVTLIDKEENTLVVFLVAGYQNIEGDLQKYEVKKIKIVDSRNVSIILGDAIEDTNSDPGNDPGNDPSDPGNDPGNDPSDP